MQKEYTLPKGKLDYIFDLDGTLVDSVQYFVKEMLGLLDRHGISYGDDMIRILNPMGMSRTAEYFAELGVQLSPEEIKEEIISALIPHYKNDIVLKPHVKECLEYINSLGLEVNLLTAGSHRWVEDCLRKNGIIGYFNNIWASTDFGLEKSDPNIYKEAANRLGAELDEVIYVDDDIHAVTAAKKGGLNVIGTYDDSSRVEMENIMSVADGYIMDFSELLDMIKEQQSL